MFKEKHFCFGATRTYSKKARELPLKSPWNCNIIRINAIDNNWKQADTNIQYSYHGQKTSIIFMSSF
jgi:hypothetical protein|tara:strand:- start:1524 stop:1724 length:201 start_codon:yes stop_codon:yes gene_type:complete